jgi:hypothetical protein
MIYRSSGDKSSSVSVRPASRRERHMSSGKRSRLLIMPPSLLICARGASEKRDSNGRECFSSMVEKNYSAAAAGLVFATLRALAALRDAEV